MRPAICDDIPAETLEEHRVFHEKKEQILALNQSPSLAPFRDFEQHISHSSA